MSAILHYQYSITHFAAKAKHFYREPAAKGRLPHRLLQTAGTGPAGSPSCGRAALRACLRPLHSSLHIAAPVLKTGPAAVPRYRAGLAFPY